MARSQRALARSPLYRLTMSPFLFCSLARLVLLDVGLEKFVTHLTVVVVQIVAVLTGSTLLAKVTLLFLAAGESLLPNTLDIWVLQLLEYFHVSFM